MAFHLGLHCLPKYPFRGVQSTKGKLFLYWKPLMVILANSADQDEKPQNSDTNDIKGKFIHCILPQNGLCLEFFNILTLFLLEATCVIC